MIRNRFFRTAFILCLAFIFEGNTFYPVAAEKPTVNTDCGDYTYFDSNYPVISGKYYFNTEVYTKSDKNSISFGRLDYKNPNRDNGITITKNDSGADTYIDVNIKKSSLYKSAVKYKYFVMSADISVPKIGAETYLFRIRDNALYKQEGYKSDRNLLWIAADGTLNTADGKKIEQFAQLHTDKTASVKMYIELETNTADIYIDGEPFAEKIGFYHKIEAIDKVRLSLNSGTGSLYLKNCNITGLEKPYSGGSDTKSAVFHDDAEIKNYLENKVVFHYYGKKMMKNGVKYDLISNPALKNDTLYVSLNDFNKAFDMNITENTLKKLNIDLIQNDGIILVPAAETAEKAAGKYSFSDNGAVYISDSVIDMEKGEPIYKRDYSASPVTELTVSEMLSDYVLYDRPKAAELKTAFERADNSHPRLFANKAELDEIVRKAGENPQLIRILNTCLNTADNILNTEPTGYEFEDSYRMISRATEFQNNMLYLGFAYRVTGANKYAGRAWRELEEITAFPDLNTPHVIDTGTFLTGLGIAYDWFYGVFSNEQLKKISDTAINLGIKPLNDAYYGRLQGCAAGSNDKSTQISGIFPKWTSNYNAIANSGVLVAALAMAEENPDLCFDSAEKAVRSIEYTLKGFNPSGGWIEGPDYCSLTLSHLNRAAEALKSVFGTDYGLTASPGLDKTAEFIISLKSGGIVNNFHDSGTSFNGDTCLTWLGGMFHDDAAVNFRKRQIDSLSYSTSPMEVIAMGKSMYETDTSKMPDKLIVTKGTESFSMRNSYNENAAYLSAHGGAVSAYHAHNDAGAFVLGMSGEQWAVDIGKESYNAGVTDRLIYRKRTEGHNTLTINNDENFNQLADGFAAITRYDANDSQAYTVYDMSGLYSDADKVIRGFFADKHYSEFTIRDEVNLNKESEIYWFMHTRAEDIQIDGNIVTLTQNGKSIKMNFICDASDYEIMQMNAAPLESSYPSDGTNPYENQNPNEGIRKITVKISSGENVNLTVKFSESGAAPNNIPVSQWSVSEEEECDTIMSENFEDFDNVRVTDSAKITTENGLFGRSEDDKSLVLSGKGGAKILSDSEKELKNGETARLSFYYAFDSSFTPIRLDAGKKISDFVKITSNQLSIAGSEYKNPLYHTENKWYHFELLLDKNGFKAYIDNIALFDGEFNYPAAAEFIFNIPNGGKIYIDDFEIKNYINGAVPQVITETGIHGVRDEIERYAGASVIRIDGDISCGDFLETARFDAAENIVLRNENGADDELSGKYADVTLTDGSHRYLKFIPLDGKLLHRAAEMIEPSKSWHKNGTWSSIGRSVLVGKKGVGGRLDDDESIVMQGPFKKASDADIYGHDYLDFSVMCENSVSSYNEAAFCPIVFEGSFLVSGGAMFETDIKINNKNSYTALFRTENGGIYCGMNPMPQWEYRIGEWIDFSVSLYPGKTYADVTINGSTARIVYTNSEETLDFVNIIRFGAKSYDMNENGCVALDDISVYSGKNSSAVKNVRLMQDGAAVKGYYSGDGSVKINAQMSDAAAMYAALYENGTLKCLRCGAECTIDNASFDGAEIKLMIWNGAMTPLTQCRRFIYKSPA